MRKLINCQRYTKFLLAVEKIDIQEFVFRTKLFARIVITALVLRILNLQSRNCYQFWPNLISYQKLWPSLMAIKQPPQGFYYFSKIPFSQNFSCVFFRMRSWHFPDFLSLFLLVFHVFILRLHASHTLLSRLASFIRNNRSEE